MQLRIWGSILRAVETVEPYLRQASPSQICILRYQALSKINGLEGCEGRELSTRHLAVVQRKDNNGFAKGIKERWTDSRRKEIDKSC